MIPRVASPSRLPRPLPVLGYAHKLGLDPLGFIESMRSAGDLVPVPLPGAAVFLVNSPALVRRVLLDSTFERGVQADRLRAFLGDGLVTSDGPRHLRNRRLVQPAFHRQRIAGYAEVMREEAEAMTRRWRAGVEIAADVEVMQSALRVVGRTLFSADLGAEVVDEVVRSVPILLDGIGRRARDPFALLEKLPTAGNREFNAARQRLGEVVDRVIAQYRASGVDHGGVDHGDMASMLLQASDAETGERLSDLEVRDEVLTMFAAGTDTTSNTVSWVLHVLGGRADLQDRLFAEIDEVVGDRPIELADVPRLEFIRRLVSETLRLYPQAWMLIRTATVPVRLGDTDLPAGTSVLLPLYALQRDPTAFPEPEHFDPDRWAPERVNEAMRPSFLPFSAGRHVCIGEAFAWTEATIMLAVIGREWRLEPVPDRPVRINSLTTLKPTQLPMIPRRR